MRENIHYLNNIIARICLNLQTIIIKLTKRKILTSIHDIAHKFSVTYDNFFHHYYLFKYVSRQFIFIMLHHNDFLLSIFTRFNLD